MNDQQIWPKFAYNFSYKLDFGWEVQVNVDHLFNRESDLTTLSKFPLKQRKKFANHVMQSYREEKFTVLKAEDLINPFAKCIDTLLGNGIQIYWIKCPNNTVLIFFGLDPMEKTGSDSGSHDST